ncbi:MAG: alpha/beta hydrolase [Anaerolineales bacterium]|nr:alpha/beta hydrolase [Anaerolineales bacterium]
MKTQFITFPDRVRIAYDTNGQGPALMLLHGAGKDRQDRHKLGYVERLESDFTVITVDIRGSGESEFLTQPSDFAIEKICADLYAVADACDAQRFAIWGYSFGGNIARYLGAWSDRVTALAVIGVPFGPAVDETFDRFIENYLEKYGHIASAYQDGEAKQKKPKSKTKAHIPVFAACFQAMRACPSIQPIDLKCPAILLVGSRNKNLMKYVQSEQSALDAAGIQMEIINGLNHQQEFSQIDQVFPVVSTFLNGRIEG